MADVSRGIFRVLTLVLLAVGVVAVVGASLWVAKSAAERANAAIVERDAAIADKAAAQQSLDLANTAAAKGVQSLQDIAAALGLSGQTTADQLITAIKGQEGQRRANLISMLVAQYKLMNPEVPANYGQTAWPPDQWTNGILSRLQEHFVVSTDAQGHLTYHDGEPKQEPIPTASAAPGDAPEAAPAAAPATAKK